MLSVSVVECGRPNATTITVTGKPVLVDEEITIEKHQKFKLGGSDVLLNDSTVAQGQRLDVVTRPGKPRSGEWERLTESALNFSKAIAKPKFNHYEHDHHRSYPLSSPVLNGNTMQPVVLDPVRPEYKVAPIKSVQDPHTGVINNRLTPDSAEVGDLQQVDKLGEKEVVLASYRVVIPIFIPKVLVPVNYKSPNGYSSSSSNDRKRKDDKIHLVETKSTKLVPLETNVTYINEVYKPELVHQRVITDYVVNDPKLTNGKPEKIVKTVVRDITEPPIVID